jgi:PAS domain S-box-containing protein
MAEGILVSGSQGYFTLMNHAAEDMWSMERRDVLGRSAEDSFESSPISIGFDPESLIGLSKPFESTFNLEERRIRVHAAPVLTGEGNRLGVVSILQDITREYLAEQSKREFIASISHELRTPLTAIKGYTEVMLSGMAGELPPAFGQFLGVIRENTTRMTSLTNNIISVAEIEQGRVGLNYQDIEVPDVINELLSRYQERVEERMLTIKVDFPDELPTIEVDPNRLRLVLDNLLSNAIKFTYPSGHITIGCRGIQGTLGKPTFFSIWLSDTGVGIPVEEQNRIWERFYRVENPLSLEAGGLGIGLTITRALVEAHGGRVWVDSTLDEGSTFTVLMPIFRSQGAVAELDLEMFW